MSIKKNENGAFVPYDEQNNGLYNAVKSIQEAPMEALDALANVSECYFIHTDGTIGEREKEDVRYYMRELRKLIKNIHQIELE